MDVLFALEESLVARFDKSNAARVSAAADGLTEANLYLFSSNRWEKMQTNLAGTSKKDTHLLVCVFLFLYMSAYPKNSACYW